MNKQQYIFLAIGGIALLLMLNTTNTSVVKTVTGSWDISAEVEAKGYTQYIQTEPDFDYLDANINALAKNIKSTTSTPKEAVSETIKYVVKNVRYSTVNLNYCYQEKASDVLKAGHGDCVSMSRAVTALLRAQGIPARTMGGCLSFKTKCTAAMAAVPGAEAQFTPMSIGDFKKRGFLHEWVEFYIPENNGWQILESTAAVIYPLDCASYIEYSYDNNAKNRCEITDSNFWDTCKEA